MDHYTLPKERLTSLDNFGHSIHSPVYYYRPTQVEEIAELLEKANKHGFLVGQRGAGRSYGDAALTSGGVLMDFSDMNHILEWNPETGVIKVEPGVTIEQLWRHTMKDGWWSPVTPGTMFPTMGGCLGANVHGKNNWRTGTMGEHVLAFTALLPNGEEVECTPTQNEELFYSIISGMGMLGVFTSLTYQMKKVYSGNLDVYAWAVPGLKEQLQGIDENKEKDYIVSWIDPTARGAGFGRGQLHSARYLAEGEDPDPATSLDPASQDLPSTIMGVIPKSIVWRIMKLGLINIGAWAANFGKYALNRTIGNNKQYLQSLVAFTFLLDYVPNWELAYGRGGLIQYQCFVPKATAEDTFREVLKLTQRRGLPSYLGVAKRHRPDNFLFSHAVDGFSLALDFKVFPGRREELAKMTWELNQIVLEGNGKLYFAKDSSLTPDVTEAYLGSETVEKFKQLKAKVDPQEILQTDLYRRLFK